MSPRHLRPLSATLGHLFPHFTADLLAGLATRPRERLRAQPPADAEPFTTRFGLAGLRWGQQGPRVLALHGWRGSAVQFAPIARELVGRGLQVLAIDAPAHGRSPGETASATTFSDALLESLPEIGPLQAVLGHSMGGGAVLYALAHGLVAERAVIVSAPAHYADVLARQSRSLALPQRASQAFVSRMEGLAGVPSSALDIAALAARYRGELLLVHDRGDRVVPHADGARIARSARAPLLSTSGLGHGRLLADPQVIRTVGAFIEGKPLAPTDVRLH